MFLFYSLFDIILLGDIMGFFSKIKNMFKGNETTVDTNTEEVLDTDLEKNNQEEVEEKRILTEEEKKERELLRKEYIASVRMNLRAQLDNMDVQQEDGTIINLGERYGIKKRH